MITYRTGRAGGTRAAKGGNGAAKALLSVLLTCVSLAAAASGDEKPLRARATASYQGTAGNTRNHGAAGDGKVEYTGGRWLIDGGGNYTLSVSAGEKAGESAGLSAGTKYFLTGGKRLYARYKAEWQRNVFSGFEHRVFNFAGVGAYVLKSDRQELSVEGGPNHVYERYRADSGKRPAYFIAGHAGADYRVSLNGAAEVNASVVWDMDLRNAADQLSTGKVSLHAKVAGWLDLTATEKVVWDNVPPEGYRKVDVTTSAGLTIKNY
jgi:putative salt-induced outer membrane protein YdiY